MCTYLLVFKLNQQFARSVYLLLNVVSFIIINFVYPFRISTEEHLLEKTGCIDEVCSDSESNESDFET